MSAHLSSGDLARATGNTVRTIRFYEEQALLKPAVVSGGGHRRYTPDDLERLRLILDLRELGLSLCEIRTFLDLREGCDTAAEFAVRFQEVLTGHLENARQRLGRLKRVSRELAEALSTIEERIACELSGDCPCAVGEAGGAPRIVKVLAKTGSCQHHAHGGGLPEGEAGSGLS
jgi:DNA-binding transcriptional MerR regulator